MAGFLFDVFTLSRIDDPFTIAQQVVYLILLSLYVALEFREEKKPIQVPERFKKIWSFHTEAAHFIFGSLLSLYTLFYFKSASLISAGFFMIVIAAILVANEFEAVKRLGPAVRVALLSFCLTSFFAAIVPMILGFIGMIPFLIAIGLTILWLYLLRKFVNRILGEPSDDRAWTVGAVVQGILLTLYVLRAIPPIPLSANFLGIYHEVRAKDGKFELLYDRPFWKIWQRGDQTFKARPGDKIYAFASVFSPSGVQDQIRVRWSYHDPRSGWQKADAIPISVRGGREQGFRGFAFKQNYTPGDWRVSLETSDGREFARLGFTVVPDTSTERRTYYVDVQ
ncbi:MAG TPA: DUF2914 domain-containing protein [Bdellovibrionales bacterium]|nr:DUF2914 domain-containing protein [Bdellovibrionales bacterium]